MATEAGGGEPLPPDDSFSALGNGTRMEILQALDRPPEPLAGSELRGAGRRVLEAVLSGAVTETPVLEATPVEDPYHFCGGRVEVSDYEERLERYCNECEGQFGAANRTGRWAGAPEHGYLGYHPFPPTGLEGRDAPATERAAWVWGSLEIPALASGLCPRCSATVERRLTVCEDHDAADGLCATCDRLQQVNLNYACTNCIYGAGGSPVLGLVANRERLEFTTPQGLTPVNPASPAAVDELHANLEEDVRSIDPFEAAFTRSYGGASITLTVDDEFRATAVSESSASG